MKLKYWVGAAIIIFVCIVLYYMMTGMWMPKQAPTPAQIQQSKAAAGAAAKDGLFDEPAPPIVH